MDSTQPDAPIPQDPPSSRPPRRRWVVALVALHALSAVAAAVILYRGHRAAPAEGGGSRLKLLAKHGDAVGWITIHGVIKGSEGGRAWSSGVDAWTRKLRSLAEKSDVKAIVLDIDSPGGTVGAVQELHSAVLRVRKEKGKPIVALLGDVAASGGYYVAAGCDRIVAHPGSLVGSIGVIFNTMNVQGLFAKIGLRSDPIKSGKHKDIGSPTRPMTPEEREILQGLIDNAYAQFLKAVSEGRKMPEDEARPLADGRIFTGEQAKGLKLVDDLGDSRDALAVAGKLGGIGGTPKVLRQGDSFEDLLEMIEFRLPSWLRPQAAIAEWTSVSPALEYRWLGF